MKCQLITFIVIISQMQLQSLEAAPSHSNDIDYNDSGSYGGGSGGGGSSGNIFRQHHPHNMNAPMDYNMVFSHVKDFFMYLPVMMSTLKESMNGFPKFAEGIRILTSRSGRLEGGTGGDCNCDKNSNEVGNSRFG